MGPAGMRRSVFVAWLGAIVAVVLLQPEVHLEVVVGFAEVKPFADLDRSNGLPALTSLTSRTST